jgi:hypothetical protein
MPCSHALKPVQEVEVPPGAPELAVRDRFQPDRFLLPDDVADGAVLDIRQFVAPDPSLRSGGAGCLEFRRPQQAADLIGPKRRPVPHDQIPSRR